MYFPNWYFILIAIIFAITVLFMLYVGRWYKKRRPPRYYLSERRVIRDQAPNYIIISIELLLFGIPALIDSFSPLHATGELFLFWSGLLAVVIATCLIFTVADN